MRETNNLEYKRELSKTYLKTVSAFANYETGQIVFGVNDDGTPIGVENPDDVCLRIENTINDAIIPVPRFTLEVNEALKTVTLTVFKGAAKPYLYQGKAYRRADSSTVEVSRLEYNRLALSGSNTSFDELEAATQNLSFTHLEEELIRKTGITRLDENTLISLELKSPEGRFNNAAALLADENRFFGTDIARFGDNINIILSRRTIEKTSALEQMKVAMAIFDEHYTYEEVIGFERAKKSLIPREAFREAIANALVHRCWDVNASIKVSMYPDRIEILSPGGLPDGITEEEYIAGGPSVVRNPILANVFYRLGHIERFGTGIPRIIEQYAALSVSPVFSPTRSTVTVTLPVENSGALTADERSVLDAIPKGSMLTRTDIEAATTMSKSKVIRIINSLSEKNLIEKSGAGRGVRYSRD